MKVTVALVDLRFGLPAVGEELILRDRDYHDTDREFRLIAVVRQRRWIFSQNKPAEPELRLIVEATQNK